MLPARAQESEARPDPRARAARRYAELLKSESALTRELAALALRTCGTAGEAPLAEALKKDPEFLETLGAAEVRLPRTDLEQDVVAALRRARVDVDLQEADLDEILAIARKAAGVPMVVEPDVKKDAPTFSIKVKSISVDGLLKILLPNKDMAATVAGGGVRIHHRSRPVLNFSMTPLRLPWAVPGAFSDPVARLADPKPAIRQAAAASLKTAGFAAEEALWKGLEEGDAETATRCNDLLRHLFGSPPEVQMSVPSKSLEGKLDRVLPRMGGDEDGMVDTADAVEWVQEESGTAIALLDAPERIHHPVIPMKASAALSFMTGPTASVVGLGDVAYLVDARRLARSVPEPDRPLWVPTEMADRLEAALATVAAGGEASFTEFGLYGLHALRMAAATGRPGFAGRADALLASLEGTRCFVDRRTAWLDAAKARGGADADRARKLEERVDFHFPSGTCAALLARLKDKCGIEAFADGVPGLESPAPGLFLLNVQASEILEAVALKLGARLRIADGRIRILPALR